MEPSGASVDGSVYDRSTIAEFFGQFSFITQIVRDDVMAESELGTGYQLTETYDSGATGTFWIFVARDDAGVLTITEQKEAPT